MFELRLLLFAAQGYSLQVINALWSYGRLLTLKRNIMPRSAYLTCLWPGLARAWWAGDAKSLFLAVLFAVLVNTLLVFTAFPELGVAETYWILGWVAAISWWGAAFHSSASELPFILGMSVKLGKPGDLSNAQVAFLKRDYVATESIISKILTNQPHDPAVRLLLASTFRQTGRIEEARSLLSSLQREPAALAWQFEIEADLARLDRLEKPPQEEATTSPKVESRPRVVEASSEGESARTAARQSTASQNTARRSAVRRAA